MHAHAEHAQDERAHTVHAHAVHLICEKRKEKVKTGERRGKGKGGEEGREWKSTMGPGRKGVMG
jgi:hypothetical protein